MKYIGTVSLLILLLGCQSSEIPTNNETTSYRTDIRWTSFGIPHVTATNWSSLGYGFAYATAQDAICVIAREVITTSGELAKYQGREQGRLQSDIFYKAFLNDSLLESFYTGLSENSKAFYTGYAKGYNRFLQDHAETMPRNCRSETWVRPIVVADVARMTIGAQIRYGLGQHKLDIVNAGLNGESTDLPPSVFTPLSGIGSNGVALGGDVTASGRGILLGNPHYPWQGPSRFHLIHTTIPGVVDVMGVSLMTTPKILIGFNKDVAWTHTVSSALRTNVYELSLNPTNSMQYLFEGEYRDIKAYTVEVEVLHSSNASGIESHTLYTTHHGPILVSREFPWNKERAYAIRDANHHNNHHDATYDALHVAKNIHDVEKALSHQGVALANTIAVDRHGTAAYIDNSVTPNLDAEQLKTCRRRLVGVPDYFVVLDGSQKYCEWKTDPRAQIPGVMPVEEMPKLRRRDYVTNSNDSYWLSNPNTPMVDFSPTIGRTLSERSLRTRAGLTFVDELIKQGKIQPEDLQNLLYSHRNYAAEVFLDDVLTVCSPTNKTITEVCKALKGWNRKMDIDSRGGHVWREFWTLVKGLNGLYTIPFDVLDPVNTPRGIALDNPVIRTALVEALVNAQDTLNAANIRLDQPLREIQYTTVGSKRIPIPGGDGGVGMFSLARGPLQKNLGYTPIYGGNSFIQVISWDKKGTLDARGILTYSQSQEPDSQHNSDMTILHSEGGWLKLPFTDAEINGDPELHILRLTE